MKVSVGISIRCPGTKIANMSWLEQNRSFHDHTLFISDSSIYYFKAKLIDSTICCIRSVRVAESLALPTSDHGVAGSNPAGGKILPEPKRRLFAQSLSCSLCHRLEMTEILLKGRKTLTHPSIHLLQKSDTSHDTDTSFIFPWQI